MELPVSHLLENRCLLGFERGQHTSHLVALLVADESLKVNGMHVVVVPHHLDRPVMWVEIHIKAILFNSLDSPQQSADDSLERGHLER